LQQLTKSPALLVLACPAGQWAQLSPFQRILVLRALKPDRLPAALAAL